MAERDVDAPSTEEAAFITATLKVFAYVRPDGTNGYSVSAKGDSPMTTYLGLTVIAQKHIIEWGDSGITYD